MNVTGMFGTGYATLDRYGVFTGIEYAGWTFLGIFVLLLVLLGVVLLLRLFFRRHPLVTRAHKVLIYLLTMTGVIALLAAGVLGLLLPIIPGIPFVLAGLLLMRKYHKVPFVERIIGWCKKKARHLRRRGKEKLNKMRTNDK
jgi:hypothetical protein